VGGVRSGVVAQAGSDGAEQLPAPSQALTEWQYWTATRSPVTVASCDSTFATTFPSRSSSYRITPTSSVDALHVSRTAVSESARAATSAGRVGGVTSGGVAQTGPAGVERLPAASSARTA
jgi:hypothetical protein